MKKILVASLLSSLFAVPAFAAVPGAYIAADLQGWSVTNTTPFGNPTTGFSIGGGYRFTPNVGVELDIAQSGASNSIFGASYKVGATQLAAVGTYPINPQFDVFAKVGISSNKVTTTGPVTCTNCSKNSLMFGVGAQYNINQQVGIRLQYLNLGDITNAPVGPQMSATTTSLGVVYGF